MNKEKMHIPSLNDQTIDGEVSHIVAKGIPKKKSFLSFTINLYKEIGLRYLFINRREGILISLGSMVVLLALFILVTDSLGANIEHVYALVFLMSPLLYMALTLYDLLNKKYSATYEVEMVAKYNIYQVAAFRMLYFSLIAMIVNSISIALLVWMNDRLEFFRAFLISTIALFLFSVLFLMVFTKVRSGIAAVQIGVGWIVVNSTIYYFCQETFISFLKTGPFVLYTIVLLMSIYIYIVYLSRLVRIKPAEGVF